MRQVGTSRRELFSCVVFSNPADAAGGISLRLEPWRCPRGRIKPREPTRSTFRFTGNLCARTDLSGVGFGTRFLAFRPGIAPFPAIRVSESEFQTCTEGASIGPFRRRFQGDTPLGGRIWNRTLAQPASRRRAGLVGWLAFPRLQTALPRVDMWAVAS